MTLALEDELELLDHDIRAATRRLESIERAPYEGRWTRDAVGWEDACANQRQRIRVLEDQRADVVSRIEAGDEA